jgi:hypothetical protein
LDYALPKSKSKPPIIHITSSSASTTTALLYHLTALAILPTQYSGKSSAAIWIDTTQSFSALRLSTALKHILPTSTTTLSPTQLSNITTSSLKHLYIISPPSSTSFLHTLHHLPAHIHEHISIASPNRPLGLLILNSTTAFHHQDRFSTELTRLEAGATSTNTNTPSRQSQVIAAVKTIQTEFDCAVILTSQPPSQSNPSDQRAPNSTPFSPFTSSSTLTLFLTPLYTQVPQFRPELTLEQCLHDRTQRQEAVRKGRVGVGVVHGLPTPGAGMGRKGFVMRVGEGRVEVERE